MANIKIRKVVLKSHDMKSNDPRRCKGLCCWVYRDNRHSLDWFECVNCGNKIEVGVVF